MRHFLALIFTFISFVSFGQDNSTKYSFFIAGHTYGSPGVNNEGFHPPFKAQFEYLQSRTEIELGVLTGDIVSSSTSQNWDEVDAEIDTLGIPIHFAAGNHDMENRPLFEDRYGSTYYSFQLHNDLFIILDPNVDEWSISGDQLTFLQNAIQNYSGSCENIFVFFHQVLWKEPGNEFGHISWNSSAGRGEFVNFWTEVFPLFNHLPNQVTMFAGDVGVSWATDISYDIYENTTLISSGMGDEEGENYVIVNVDSDKNLTYDLICLSDPDSNCLGELTDHIVVNKETNTPAPILLPYPNPTTDVFTIHLDSKKNYSIEIFNAQGQLVFEENVADTCRFEVNIEHLANGVYTLKRSDENEESIVKLLVE